MTFGFLLMWTTAQAKYGKELKLKIKKKNRIEFTMEELKVSA